MTGIRIVTTTEKGAKALRQAHSERTKATLRERMTFASLYRQQYTEADHPLLEVHHRNERLAIVLPPSHLKEPFIHAMKQNGAKLNTDYKIEEVA